MLNWIRERLLRWLKTEPGYDIYEETIASGRHGGREFNGTPDMVVSVYGCTNGYVVEGTVYHSKSRSQIINHDEPGRQRVIVLNPDVKELSEAIALIYVKGKFGAAA